jgi:AcrR family transcriptional regulator
MTLPTPDDAEILEHARAVFAERGNRATAADVAERVGVSEALLFKRFRTKDNLFMQAMMKDFLHVEAEWLNNMHARVGQGCPRENLVLAGIEAIAFYERLVPLIMLVIANPTGHPASEMHKSPNAPPFESRRQVEMYFEAERRLGRIRSADTEILARSFVGALFSYVFWETNLGQWDPRPLGPRAFVRGLVEHLWAGLDPAPPPKPHAEFNPHRESTPITAPRTQKHRGNAA